MATLGKQRQVVQMTSSLREETRGVLREPAAMVCSRGWNEVHVVD